MDSDLRGLERRAAGGDPSATIALEREKARSGTCPACDAAPACYLLEGEDEESRLRTCQSKLPPCEDCEGDQKDDRCDEDGDGHLEDCTCDPCSRCEGSGLGLDPYGIVIDGEGFILETTNSLGYSDGNLCELSPSGGYSPSYIVAIDADEAGKAARERWAEMAEDDPSEFAEMVGTETLVQWGMGHWAGPGSTQVRSLTEWLDLHLETPEEEWAGYDGNEGTVTETGSDLRDAIGYSPSVAYRSN